MLEAVFADEFIRAHKINISFAYMAITSRRIDWGPTQTSGSRDY